MRSELENQYKISTCRIRFEILLTKFLVRLIDPFKQKDLNPEAHLYFADRYGRLANILESEGKKEQAEKMHDLAGYHYHLGGEKEPPPAAAAMMPVPRPRLFTSAISEHDEYK